MTRDPSRIAAQIVTGVGFLGAGLIFVNKDVVRGLTTAASIWVAASIGMACGAGLLPLAMFATILHFVAILVVAPLGRLHATGWGSQHAHHHVRGRPWSPSRGAGTCHDAGL